MEARALRPPTNSQVEWRSQRVEIVREVTTYEYKCVECGRWYVPRRADATTCSEQCRAKKGYRSRKEAQCLA